jgi:hypothetical protein
VASASRSLKLGNPTSRRSSASRIKDFFDDEEIRKAIDAFCWQIVMVRGCFYPLSKKKFTFVNSLFKNSASTKYYIMLYRQSFFIMTRKSAPINEFSEGVSGKRRVGRPTKEHEPMRGYERALSGKKKR